jgi:hypothetical protein
MNTSIAYETSQSRPRTVMGTKTLLSFLGLTLMNLSYISLLRQPTIDDT